MTAEEWLNVLAILESIDEVPGMPDRSRIIRKDIGGNWSCETTREQEFIEDPIRFLRRADDATRAAIWTEVTRRINNKEQ